MNKWTRLASSIAVIGLLVGLSGCGDTTVGDRNGRDDPGEPVDDPGARLQHVDPCQPTVVDDEQHLYDPCVSKDVTFNSSVTLQAKLTLADGSPLANQRVHYGIVDDETIDRIQNGGHPDFSEQPVDDEAEGMTLDATAVATDENGVAEMELNAGTDSGVTRVVAWIDPSETAGPDSDANYLRWRVPVQSKSRGGLTVQLEQAGEAEVSDAEVLLYSSDQTCDDLQTQFASRRHSDSGGFQPPPAELRKDGTIRSASGQGEVEFLSLSKETEFTVWARAYGASNPDIEKTWGCAETDPIQGGQTKVVDVPLYDHVPILQETYDVTHQFNLTDALPEDIQSYIDLIGMFVKSPASLLLGCEQGDKGVDGREICPNGDVDGVLVRLLETDFLDGLPVDASDVRNVVNSIIGDSIRTALDQELFNLIDGTPIAGGVQVTEDIYDTITRFGVRGTIAFPGSPQPTLDEDSGQVRLVFQQGGGKQSWQEIAFFDTNGNNCSAASDFNQCRTSWYDVGKLVDDGAAIEGEFSAEVTGLHSLTIDQHDLNIQFGGLVIGAIEHIVLPRYFSNSAGGSNVVANLDEGCVSCQSGAGDGVVSFEEVFANTLADCGQLANSVGSDGDTLHTTFENICGDLRGRLIDRAKEEIVNQLTVDGGVLSIQTPTDGACTMYEPANYDNAPDTHDPLPFIRRLGQETSGSRCPWDVTLEFSESANNVSGTFYGESTL